VSFLVLINGSTSNFFRAERGLRQGCALSPLLFLLVVECLTRLIAGAIRRWRYTGINITKGQVISHLLFVDDLLMFCNGNMRHVESLSRILILFGTVTWICVHNMEADKIRVLRSFFPFGLAQLDECFKHLGFQLKPIQFTKED